MAPTTPLTRAYRAMVAGGEYEIDVDAIAASLTERLLDGRALPLEPVARVAA